MQNLEVDFLRRTRFVCQQFKALERIFKSVCQKDGEEIIISPFEGSDVTCNTKEFLELKILGLAKNSTLWFQPLNEETMERDLDWDLLKGVESLVDVLAQIAELIVQPELRLFPPDDEGETHYVIDLSLCNKVGFRIRSTEANVEGACSRLIVNFRAPSLGLANSEELDYDIPILVILSGFIITVVLKNLSSTWNALENEYGSEGTPETRSVSSIVSSNSIEGIIDSLLKSHKDFVDNKIDSLKHRKTTSRTLQKIKPRKRLRTPGLAAFKKLFQSYKTKLGYALDKKLEMEVGKAATGIGNDVKNVISRVQEVEAKLSQLIIQFDFFRESVEKSNDLKHDFDTELMSLISSNFDLNISFLEDSWTRGGYCNDRWHLPGPEKMFLKGSSPWDREIPCDRNEGTICTYENKFERVEIHSGALAFLQQLPKMLRYVDSRSESSSAPLNILRVMMTPNEVNIVFDTSNLSFKSHKLALEPDQKRTLPEKVYFLERLKFLTRQVGRERQLRNRVCCRYKELKINFKIYKKKYQRLQSENKKLEPLRDEINKIRTAMSISQLNDDEDLAKHINDRHLSLQEDVKKLKRKMKALLKSNAEKDDCIKTLNEKCTNYSEKTEKLSKAVAKYEGTDLVLNRLQQTNKFAKTQIQKYEEYLSDFFIVFEKFLPNNTDFQSGLRVIVQLIEAQNASITNLSRDLCETNLRFEYAQDEVKALMSENARLKEVNQSFNTKLQAKTRHIQHLEDEIVLLNDMVTSKTRQACGECVSTQTEEPRLDSRLLRVLKKKLQKQDSLIEDMEKERAYSVSSFESLKSQRDFLAKELEALKQTSMKNSSNEGSEPNGDACTAMYSSMKQMYKKIKQLEKENGSLKILSEQRSGKMKTYEVAEEPFRENKALLSRPTPWYLSLLPWPSSTNDGRG